MIDLSDFIVKQGHTRRLYRCTCDKCNQFRGYKRIRDNGLGMCRSCVSSSSHKGKIVSDETKLKMRENHFLHNGGTHPLLGKEHSEVTKVKISRATTAQNKNYLAKHEYSGPNGTIMMKSSWEVKYAAWMDSNKIEWTYEPEFKLSNGYSYLPDFQLSNGDIIEIKGYMREDAQKKWDLFCSDYPELNKKLIRKSDMKKLDLI